MSIFRQLFTTSNHEEIKKESSSLTFLDEKDCETDFNTNSRLSKNLIEIISDKNCICYFVQFLETKNALSLIKFYLDAENFKTVAENSLKIISKTLTSKIELKQKQKNENLEKANKRVITQKSDDISLATTLSSEYCDNNEHVNLKYFREKKKYVKNDNDDCGDISGIIVPELKSLCDLSMRKPLTDDEKSRIIYAENKSKRNKEQQQQLQQKYDIENLPVKTPLSSSRKFNTSVATDAVRIYKKYLTLNSQYFIDIPATITSTISLALCAQHDNDEIESPSVDTATSNGPSSLTTDSDDTDYENDKVTTITISPNCFEEAKSYVFDRMENEYLNEFLESVFYCKYCLEILTNFKNLKLTDILYNESAIFYFMEYLEQEKKQIYLEFWMAAINFREHYHNKCKISNYHNDDNNDDSKIKKNNDNDSDIIENDNIIKDAQNDAMILYEKYFSLQSSNPLNISNNIRCKIEELICSKKLLQISKCFDTTLKLIENYLEINYFEKFLKSQLYSNYINELRNKLKNDDNYNFYNTNNQLPPLTPLTNARKLLTPSLSLNKKDQQQNDDKLQRNNGRGHRKTMSDCTNENTKCLRIIGDISQHNTLLAMENSSSYLNSNKLMNNRYVDSSTSNNMQIETKYLINPDLLWHRNSMITSLPTGGNNCGSSSSGSGGGGLTFGRVDALGRYERDFDLMEIHDNKDNKWSLGGSKIKNVVRKLVNLPEEKVQEEIAWQVAELIVKDITSITLGSNYNMNKSAVSASATKKTSIPSNINNYSSSGCGEKRNNDDNSNSNRG